jgi:NAD(P)-dependent dehydrogenase (short-subunit alcohol dehydrogenase family)
MRALIVGGGRRGLALARELTSEGHAVRVVTRTEDHVADIEAIGAEAWRGDPDRIGTLRYALDNVTLLLWLLGTASGDPEQVAALHGSRLEMMLERTVDTTVRGVVYEASGPLPAEVYASGLRELRRAQERNEVPWAPLEADPADLDAWLPAARAAMEALLGPRRGVRPAA